MLDSYMFVRSFTIRLQVKLFNINLCIVDNKYTNCISPRTLVAWQADNMNCSYVLLISSFFIGKVFLFQILGDRIIVITRPMDKKKILFYNDKSFQLEVDEGSFFPSYIVCEVKEL